MYVIKSTVEILLIDNNQASSLQVEDCLSQIKSSSIQLTKLKYSDDILDSIQHLSYDLIFFVLEEIKDNNILDLLKTKKINFSNVSVVFCTSEIDIDWQNLPFVPDNCLTIGEISSNLLENTIFFTLKHSKKNQELILLKQENTVLDFQIKATRKLFKAIVDNTSTLVWMCDEKGSITFLNQAWNRFVGSETAFKLDKNWMLNIHPQDLADCQYNFNQALANNKGFTISYRLKNFNNKYHWISNYAVPQFTLSSEFKGLVGYCFDITAHKNTEQKLIKRAASDRLLAQITQKIHASLDLEQILQTTVDETKQFLLAEKIQINRVKNTTELTLVFESRLQDSSLICDISCDISEPKLALKTLLQNNLAQLSSGQSITQNYSEASPVHPKFCSTLLVPIICETKLWGLICLENYSIARCWNIDEINLLERIALELSVAIKQAKLYQQLAEANQELQKLSLIDGLTQIANRRKFDQYIAAEWTRLARESSPLSLIFCDLDYFKLYNDTYGHPSGDRCLREVAQAISKVIKRPTDLLARYGGEEFVLVLPNTPIEGAKYLAQQIRLQVKSLKIPHFRSEVDLYVTMSLGVSSCIPHPDFDFEVLIAAADQGLYQAKERGRNQTVECGIELP